MKRFYILAVAMIFAFAVSAQTIVFTDDFETDELPGWTAVDADGDGFNWFYFMADEGVATSASWDSGDEVALTPDNWLISEVIDLTDYVGASVSFTVWGQDPLWAGEHYAFMVSTTDAEVASFTETIIDETLPGNEIYT